MVRKLEPLDRDVPPFGEITLDDNTITHYIDVVDLPEGNAGEICSEHIGNGAAADLLGEFMLTGCHFPKEGEEQMVRTAFVCPGPGMLRKCRLTLLQATAEGEIITEVKANGDI